MRFYHGTTEENWEKIQQEGVLLGVRHVLGVNGLVSKKYKPSRCTFLATNLLEAKCYGDVVLEVDYDPSKNKQENNYIEGCWQVRVYEPIPLSNVKRIQ